MDVLPKSPDAAPPATRVRYVVLVWLCASAAIAYIPRNSISVAEQAIRSDLGLTDDAMGAAMSAFFVTYAVFQVPSGWLAHVWGTRRALPVLTVLWSAAAGLMGLAGGLPGLVTSRLSQGAAQAGIFPCATASIARWFPVTQRAVASGFLASFMSVGGALGAFFTGLLLEPLGWRWLFALYAVPGLLWAAGFYAWFRDRPQDHPAVNSGELAQLGPAPPPGPHAEPTPWGALIRSPALWWICGQQFFRAAGYIFFASWFATFLRETRGVGDVEAGLFTSLPLWGVVLGSPVGGIVSDWLLARTGSRRVGRQGLAAASMFVSAALILLSYRVSEVWGAVLLISLGSFCSSMAGPCTYAITIDMGGRHVAPVFSVMNMAGNIGATVFPMVVPWFVRTTGSWDFMLLLFAGIHAAAAFCWLMLDPRGTIFDSRPTETQRHREN
jgi:ACS family glucarate transporter-like MFS transporter